MSTYTTFLISGASRSLGLETTRQLLALSPSNRVIAGARTPEKATELQKLAKENPGRLEIVQLDVSDLASIQTAIATVGKLDIAKDGLDVLISNAGISSTWDIEESFKTEILAKDMQTNTCGPINLTAATLPLLKAGREKKIIVTTSTAGSIALSPGHGGPAAYAVSKAAVNMYIAHLALHLKPEGFTVLLHCPGFVATEGTAALPDTGKQTVQGSVGLSIKNVFGRGIENTGKFLSQEGNVIPW